MEGVYKLVQEPQQFSIFYIAANLLLHQVVAYVMEKVVGIKLHIIECALDIIHILTQEIHKIVSTPIFHAGTTPPNEGITQ